MEKGYAAYRSTNVSTADQGKLILIAYDVAINHSKQALEFFGDHSQIEARTKHLKKVQDAISELMGALKLEAGEIAQNLYRLYEYMLRRVIHANLYHEPKYVAEILDHLTGLRSAWNDAICQTKAGKPGAWVADQHQRVAITS